MKWVSGSGKRESWDGMIQLLGNSVRNKRNAQVHVGCDSAIQPCSKGADRVIFATVVCLRTPGNAGRYYYTRQSEAVLHYPVLQTRLLREVHCDSNTDPTFKSTEHTRMLTGYIQSMGYQVGLIMPLAVSTAAKTLTCVVRLQYLAKPHAWATHIADRHSRSAVRTALHSSP
ncbi:MAG: hypothetical protein SGPRY_008879 [Prymnesium sp.]